MAFVIALLVDLQVVQDHECGGGVKKLFGGWGVRDKQEGLLQVLDANAVCPA